jgi:cytochrome c peroxidase
MWNVSYAGMAPRTVATLGVAVTAAAVAAGCSGSPVEPTAWSRAELEVLRSLWIVTLEPLGPDPSNRWAHDSAAAALGHRFFFDTRLSANGRVSCASCHRPESDFQDGIPLGIGIGSTDRRTMTVAATAHSPWQFWDGRSDSQWAQALGPLESAVEHGGSRAMHVHTVARHYQAEYEALFGRLPPLANVPQHAGPLADPAGRVAWDNMSAADRDAVTAVFVNVGKAIAAYERRIGLAPSRFDRYVEALVKGNSGEAILSSDELAGLRLFIGRANCTQCHNGPLLTSNDFHNTGIPAAPALPPDRGRAVGVRALLDGEFNCRSRWSDAGGVCPELDFVVQEGHELERAFRTPTLRNVARRPPFMHAGQMPSLSAVLAHYNKAPVAPAGHSEIRPLNLTARELAQLEAFLGTLTGPLSGPAPFLAPPR